MLQTVNIAFGGGLLPELVFQKERVLLSSSLTLEETMNALPRLFLLMKVTILLSLENVKAGQDFVSSWGYNDRRIDQYAQHALCIESKSYYVNISDERSRNCPRRTCNYDNWMNENYMHAKYTNNFRYALRKIRRQDVNKYHYVPTMNVENSLRRSDNQKINEVYPRKVVGEEQFH